MLTWPMLTWPMVTWPMVTWQVGYRQRPGAIADYMLMSSARASPTQQDAYLDAFARLERARLLE